jgi:hypothetical protein
VEIFGFYSNEHKKKLRYGIDCEVRESIIVDPAVVDV